MPDRAFRLAALVQELDSEAFLAQDLFLPGVSCLASSKADAVGLLLRAQLLLLPQADSGQLWQHAGPNELEVGECGLDLQPLHGVYWRRPIHLSLPAIRWRHGEEHFVAQVPALGITVVASSPETLEKQLRHQVELSLLRNDHRDLRSLVWLTRGRQLSLVIQRFDVPLPTPRQAAVQAEEELLKTESVLDQVASDLTASLPQPAYEVEADAARLAEALAGRPPRSVLLIGTSGVGKTALIGEVVRRRAMLGLQGRGFHATSGARLVAGQAGFGMWQERCQQVVKEAARRKAILVLGNLFELADVGKSEHQGQGLGSFLRPWLQRGEVQAVAECTPEQLPLLEHLDPSLLRAFFPLRIEEPSAPKLENILREAAREWGRAVLTAQGLEELLRLHRRYATYSANPGRPLRFLAGLLFDQPVDEPITRQVVTSAFSRETGLPLLLLEDDQRLNLGEVTAWFRSRVIGQEEAVALVTDLLATIKARLARPTRPLASLLFIGPTGVGKTELARSLAEFLFGSEARLTRFDMSEYSDLLAVQRLIGGPNGEGMLTARVREQPFSVILLDEVEKADPQLFDLLLQVLGEGRLTDTSGRLADFRNCVVVMTSNLGAEAWQQGGMGLVARVAAREQAREHFTEAVRRALRPELFNRIDRIVPFSPLDQVAIRGVASRQIELLRARDGVRVRGVVLDVSDDLLGWLASKGYDPRYGARPLKRAIERELLAPLATEMNQYAGDCRLRASLSLENESPRLEVRACEGADAPGSHELEILGQLVDLRRDLQALETCDAAVELGNDIYQRERSKDRPYYTPELAEMVRLRDGIASRLAAVIRLEEESLVRLHSGEQKRANVEEMEKELAAERTAFNELLMTLFLRGYTVADAVSLAVFSEDQTTLFSLARAYADAAESARMTVALYQVVPPPPREGTQPGLRRVVVSSDLWLEDERLLEVRAFDRLENRWLALTREARHLGVIGIGLEIKGRAAWPRFGGEAGLHLVQWARYQARALVVTDDREITTLKFPEGLGRRGTIGQQPRRRYYRPEAGSGDDARRGEFVIPGRSLGDAVRYTTEEGLRALAQGVLRQ